MGIIFFGGPFRKDGKANKYVKAKCQECGADFDTRWDYRFVTKSCGCLTRFRKTHGHASQSRSKETGTYRSWSAMSYRCRSGKHMAFDHYKGKGVSVCERWESFENFLADMGERPAGKTIDRIDPSKGYFPENCRWATPKEQGRNRTNNKLLTIYGKTMCSSEWGEISGESRSVISGRLKSGWTHKEAIFGKPKD